MLQYSPNQKILAAKNVLIQELAGQSVLLNLQTEEYFGLDDVGTRMWETLIEKESIGITIDSLLDEYEGVESAQLQQDLENLIEELLANGLVEISDS